MTQKLINDPNKRAYKNIGSGLESLSSSTEPGRSKLNKYIYIILQIQIMKCYIFG